MPTTIMSPQPPSDNKGVSQGERWGASSWWQKRSGDDTYSLNEKDNPQQDDTDAGNKSDDIEGSDKATALNVPAEKKADSTTIPAVSTICIFFAILLRIFR
jgi:hypothetical protein